jgi:hypothetical protein
MGAQESIYSKRASLARIDRGPHQICVRTNIARRLTLRTLPIRRSRSFWFANRWIRPCKRLLQSGLAGNHRCGIQNLFRGGAWRAPHGEAKNSNALGAQNNASNVETSLDDTAKPPETPSGTLAFPRANPHCERCGHLIEQPFPQGDTGLSGIEGWGTASNMARARSDWSRRRTSTWYFSLGCRDDHLLDGGRVLVFFLSAARGRAESGEHYQNWSRCRSICFTSLCGPKRRTHAQQVSRALMKPSTQQQSGRCGEGLTMRQWLRQSP